MNVMWFKRDLRLQDHAALSEAIKTKEALLLVYILEPSLEADPNYSPRHFQFIKESLQDLNTELEPFQTQILCVRDEVVSTLQNIHSLFPITTLFSHRETGILLTYERDKDVAQFCRERNITWNEYQNNGVLRAVTDRKGWRDAWYRYMKAPLIQVSLSEASFISEDQQEYISGHFDLIPFTVVEHPFQKGGRKQALLWKTSFFEERLQYYSDYISKPEDSRYGCSRLSPYFAWGNLSIREVYQEAIALKETSAWKKQINAFTSRLRWQSHFIQKLEVEPRIEFEATNKGYLDLPQPPNDEYVTAWQEGQTGYPLVDASIRSVRQTGYLNFRMRCMITSFFTHHLFQHFSLIGPWLAQQFLDFEPGIHYAQMQMQAGLTGTNTVRIYSPTRNALDHDPEARFIHKYVPELRNLPPKLAIEPWRIKESEAVQYDFKYGADYPERIVDIKETRAYALKMLYGWRKKEETKEERQRILNTHVIKR